MGLENVGQSQPQEALSPQSSSQGGSFFLPLSAHCAWLPSRESGSEDLEDSQTLTGCNLSRFEKKMTIFAFPEWYGLLNISLKPHPKFTQLFTLSPTP